MRKLVRAIAFTAALIPAAPPGFAADLSDRLTPFCTPTSRVKHFPQQDHNVLRGDGILGSKLMGITLSIIESRYADCRITTSYALDFRVYNYWQSGRRPGGRATAYINFYSGGREIARQAISFGVPLGFCGPYGQPQGRAFHIQNALSANYIDIVDGISVTATRISGRLGQC
jgi:hypothetical protein